MGARGARRGRRQRQHTQTGTQDALVLGLLFITAVPNIKQRRVTKQIMQEWGRHKIALRNPPTDRMRDVHKLHITQSVPMLDENSARRSNMPQRDDDEGGKPKRISFSPASSV